MLRRFSSLVAPPRCALCARPCGADAALCPACARKLKRLPPVRSDLPCGLQLISAAPYQGIAQELIRRLKFSSRLSLVEIAAERMTRAWGAAREGLLIPVPPAPARMRNRGFDGAAMLAAAIVRRCPGAQGCQYLKRDDGPRQAGRTRAERTSDPPRIRVAGPLPPPGELWLVDDVATTGTTLSVCARALREAGAERVRALIFARADR